MKKPIIALSGALCLAMAMIGCSGNSQQTETTETETQEEAPVEEAKNTVELVNKPEDRRVDVLFDGELFTAYIYPEDIDKPVLYPIVTASGKTVTRRFPIEQKEGERVDHMHHVGHWMNYGDVNGLDFWNNSPERSAADKPKYGSIRHQTVNKAEGGNGKGILDVSMTWETHDGTVLLEEKTVFTFYNEGDDRYFDRETTLTAVAEVVDFKDNKEGAFAIRVTRELEIPTDKPAIFTDANGNPTEVKALNNEGVSGNYLSSEGIEGDDVWGTRAKWTSLYGTIENDPVSITIFDNPSNVGYPTYWHARGYGLFSANMLGQKALSDGKEELNFKLEKGQSTTFKYRMLIHSGSAMDKAALEEAYNAFVK
ncbi:MAG: PmoA family protein [Cyclobacteriaceae bacterium]|nr:PmoA family protein [Cyclobacteriaceae bacterium]